VKDWLRPSLLANHYPVLHGMRVLAILTVLQYHVTTQLAVVGILKNRAFLIRSMSIFFGMDLFFIMSGFLIGTILLHAADTGKNRGVWRFYLRRGFRTFPLYYVVLTALALLFPMTALQKHNLPYEYAYLTNYRGWQGDRLVMGWGWSLAVEEHFYLAVPLLLAALLLLRSHASRLSMLGLLWGAGLAVRLGIYYWTPGPWIWTKLFEKIYIPTHTRFDVLIAGIFLAYVHRHFKEKLDRLAQSRLLCWAVLLWGLAILGLLMWPNSFRTFYLLRLFSWGTLTSLMFVPWILALLHTKGPLVRLLSARVFLWSATFGYGIYLVHIPICERLLVPLASYLQRQHGMTELSLWPLTLALLFFCSGAVAYVLHLVVEKPALYLRDRLAP